MNDRASISPDGIERIVPVILAGGVGTRLWPLSRAARPKQFLPLLGEESLFQDALRRVSDPARYHPPIISTNAEYRFLAAEQARETGIAPGSILVEPMARSTAPAMAAAAMHAASRFGEDAILQVLPSDHALTTDDDYHASVDTALAVARLGRHVTFGIRPTSPETGYGYIEAGAPVSGDALEVRRFVEKPDRATAEEFVGSGNFLWNSGMFMLHAGAFLGECADRAPDVHKAVLGAIGGARQDFDFIWLDAESFGSSPSVSVDYAIFEHTARGVVIPARFGWSDVGSWNAVWKVSEKDEAGNSARGPVTAIDTRRSLILSDKAHVAVDGLDDVAIIASEDAIFVGRLSDSQKVGRMVRLLAASSATADLTTTHRTTLRPWGGFTLMGAGDGFQAKHVFVKPGRQLSLQRHRHRSEHWIVVRGTAEVTVDGQVSTLTENGSVRVPAGSTHRLANSGRDLLELVEIQTGSYLNEDDIIRIEDDFGRA